MTIYDYAAIGGVPVVNNALTYYYVQSQACPFDRITDSCACPTLLGLPGGIPANPSLAQAPWYDPSQPELSSRFFGLYGWKITGLGDTNRSTQIVEGLDDGAWIGRTRRSARQVRVEGMLIAKGDDALDYGLAWLSAALDGDRCGQHAAACGVTDFEFFTACPPERGTVLDWGPWELERTNLALYPSMKSSLNGWAATGGLVLTATPNGIQIDTATAVATNSNIIYSNANVATAPGDWRSAALDVEVPVGFPAVTLYAYIHEYGTNTGLTPISGANVVINPGETKRISAIPPAVAPAGATGVRLLLRSGAPTGFPAGGRVIVRNALLEGTPTPGAYFDGASVGDDSTRYSWTGAANASTSIMETREQVERPETDAEYAESVDPLRRYLHEVTCTSGPLEKRRSARDDWNMMDVEFTLTAGRPWIFEAMRHPDLPTTGSTVIEDTAHNLVPYTSAELGGALQTIAENFTPNPSVETNATGWSVVTDGTAITPAMVVGARVTGELAANGTASYRTVFTATGASAAAGWFGAQQEVNFSGRPAGAPVSINMWAAEVLMAGAPVRTDITFTAIWMNGATEVSREVIGTVPVDGGANSARSLVPPAGATSVITRAQANLTSWPAGTILRMYADALAVTVP